jgi:uncharacterized protein
MQTELQTNLTKISQLAIELTKENEVFVSHLKQFNSNELDVTVGRLNNTISPAIDCTQCGNCCKSLMIVVEENEADAVAKELNISRKSFEEKYIEKGNNGMMLVNKIPCHFLNEHKCTIYEHRFGGCKEFPAMHLPNFKERLFTTFMHYDRCPIIFNIVEQLKFETGFKN